MTAQQVQTVKDLFAAAARGSAEDTVAGLTEDSSTSQTSRTPFGGIFHGHQDFFAVLHLLGSTEDAPAVAALIDDPPASATGGGTLVSAASEAAGPS